MNSKVFISLANKCLSGYKSYSINPNRLASTFKAAVLKESGKPLAVEEKKIKKLEKNQVRVQIHYCSVNSYDIEYFKQPNLKLPFVPGYEFSGEVLEVGENVNKVSPRVGDRVVVLSANKGGFAEQCVVDAGDVWNIPSKVKLKAAAVLIHGHTNAIYTFSHLVKLKENSTLIISTGSAGLGLAAVDVAANVFKVKPFGVCDTDERGTLIRERGAFQTSSFSSKDLLADFGLKKKVDVVFDAVGGDVHRKLAACCSSEGHIFYAAPFYNSVIPAPPLNTKLTMVDVAGLRTTNHTYYRQLVQDTLDIADQSLISAHVSAKFTLKDVNEAIKFIEDKKCTGKVIISMNDD